MNNERIRHLCCNQVTFSLSLALFVLLFILKNRYGVDYFPLNFLLSAFGVISIVYLFQCEKNLVMPVSFRNIVSYIGQHTLEIYLLHYFFVPKDLPYLVSVISPSGAKNLNIVMEFLVCFGMSVPVIAFSLLTAAIIRKSKVLSLLYLGKKI